MNSLVQNLLLSNPFLASPILHVSFANFVKKFKFFYFP